MIRAARRTVFSIIVLGSLVPCSLAGFTPAMAQGVDLSTLPRVAAAKVVYAGPTSTIYTTSGSVEQTAEAVSKALAAAGWQAYGDPFSQAAPNAQQRIMNFKKGPQAIVAFVSLAPAQGNAASVSYSANALTNDLPFPKDATEIGFAPERPHLRALSGEPVAALLDFFRKDMAALGYQPWTGRREHISDKGALTFFTRDNQRILVLSLTQNDEGRTRIDITPTTARVLTAENKPAVETETPEQAQAKAVARAQHERASAAMDAQIGAQIDNVLRDVQQSLRTPPAPAARSDAPVTPLHARSDNAATAPTKATQQFSADDLKVEDVAGYPVPKRRSSSGSERTPFRVVINATVPMDVTTMLAFYRDALKQRGWTEAHGASIGDARAQTAFTAPEGPATLSLERRGSDTQVRLALRKPDAAQKAGVMPKPGQAKVLIGNPNDSEAVVTINKQTLRVKPGAGAKNPADGPMLDLAPGKYQVSMKAGGKSASETIELGAGETWGLLIGPGGILPLQAY